MSECFVIDAVEHRHRTKWSALIFAAAVAAYLGTLAHGFVFDDGLAIVRNAHIRSLTNLPLILSSAEWAASGWETHLYRPLATVTYAANYAVSGLTPWSYHLTNVLLHGLVSVLVFMLGLRWRLPLAAAGLGALVFAVHPVHVEAVANVVGRKELLTAVFLIGMVLAHASAVRRGRWAIAAPLLAYAAAMLSKETGVVGLGLIAAHDLGLGSWREYVGSEKRRNIGLYAGYAGLLVGFVLVHHAIAGGLAAESISRLDNPLAHSGPLVRWLTGIAVLGRGLLLQAVPVGQSPDYSFNAIPLVESALDLRWTLSLVAIGSWAYFAVRWRQRAPAVIMGFAWYFLAILPASNLLVPIGTIFGERLLYVPSIGLTLATMGVATVALPERWSGWSRWPRAGAIVLVSALTLVTLRYAQAWRSDFTLFDVAVRNAPRSAKAHHKRSESLLALGQHAEAIREARLALDILPTNERAEVLLADALRAGGRIEEADSVVKGLLQRLPRSADALYAAGRLRRDRGAYGEAAEYWQLAIASDARHAASLADLGTYSLIVGDSVAALGYLTRAVQSDRGFASAWFNLAALHEARGDLESANEAYVWFLQVAGPEYDSAKERVRSKLGLQKP